MIRRLYGKFYDMKFIYLDCDDQGHDGTTRKRVYIILAYKGLTVCKHDPIELYCRITEHIQRYVKTAPSDYFISTDQEVLLDAEEVARTRKKKFKVVILEPDIVLFDVYFSLVRFPIQCNFCS